MELSQLFASHFTSSQRRRRESDYLMTIRQGEGESPHSYLSRFNTTTLKVRDLD